MVVDIEAYPRLFPEIKSARIVDRAEHRARVEFRAEVMLAVRYIVEVRCDPAKPAVDWTFVEGEIVTDSAGSWRFVAEGGGTRVDYRVALEIKAPLPAFIVRKATDALVTASLPGMFKAIELELTKRRASGEAGVPGACLPRTGSRSG